MASFRDLMVWQKAMRLVTEVYRLSQVFPPDERFGLTSQLRRCAVSVPSNIAEGYARNSSGDYVRFLRVAAGSLYEMETQIEVAKNLGYLDAVRFEATVGSTGEIGRMLGSLIRKVEAATRSPDESASKRCP
ncbi:MAG: four helix bundle protein [Phycisphaerae bacterium]|nr:four helix bundle protein [Phycisphaerae bacterium]